MESWISDYLANGLSGAVPSMAVSAFRVVLAVAVLAKFTADHRNGAWTFLRADGFVGYRHRRAHPRVTPSVGLYRVLYVGKFVAAGCLLLGVVPQIAAAAVTLWLFFELTFDEENHTSLLAICALLLSLSPGAADCLTWRTVLNGAREGFAVAVEAERASVTDPFVQLLIVILVTQMYLATALRKIRSADFRSGRLLHRVAEHLTLVSDELPQRQSWFPRWFVRGFALGDHDRLSARWRPAALATISLEVLVPAGLYFPATWPFAAAMGVAMHVGFGFLLPARLTSFGLASVGTYLVFASPLTAP
ncbi:hypothetical protein [Lentzea flaviverrucosa]|uniref:HTTM domain-containing protein n=1 Tax=Lentzea flaviverrucosa TaxID=200379 RepID=A0A1H9WVP1_9PSEU|nr:hypothetical protein [Lentzea flaviverrucosa]RDI23112.1 hypothetical protein DFR72_111243 [Lentzea flaviverrucosa]SES37493.1 hypothetical protein SAMN05216195_112237 [Lentzea flaviverrucosa]